MKTLSILLLVALSAPALLGAQQVEPTAPEIVLPPVLLKVKDVTQEKIDTPLPEEQAPTLPQINIALPTAQNINLGSAAYEVPVPTEGPAGAAIAAVKQPTASFFSDGLIGAGSMNHVLGDITLYKLGNEPRFSLEFSHEGLDGYLAPAGSTVFQPAGAGYFNRRDAIDGRLSYSKSDRYNFDTHDYYRETENGLQGGASIYSSVTHRFLSGSASGKYVGASPFSFGASVNATSGDMSLSVAGSPPASSPNAQELAVDPSLSIGLSFAKLSGELSGFYGVTQSSGQRQNQDQRAGGTLSLEAHLPLNLDFTGGVGARWGSTTGWVVPFSLELNGLVSDVLAYRLYGGYRVDQMGYFDLWEKYPFLNQSVGLKSSLDWYGGASTSWYFGPHLSLQGGVDFSNQTAAIIPTNHDAATGLFDFSQGPELTLAPTLAFSWNPKGPFSLNLGWKGNFLSPAPLVTTPLSTFSLDTELNSADGRYGGAITGSLDLTNLSPVALEMPNLSLSGYFRVSKGVTFHLNLSDLLSPLSGGRKIWDYYYEPGFHATVTTQISL